jgi:hypothetical protein
LLNYFQKENSINIFVCILNDNNSQHIRYALAT